MEKPQKDEVKFLNGRAQMAERIYGDRELELLGEVLHSGKLGALMKLLIGGLPEVG